MTGTDGRPLRADAAQNRERILAAAREVFVEKGAGAPLDEIARRAGTGIATLYRRFPDREALMRAVVLDAIEQTAAAARQATSEEQDPFAALVSYMHRTLDIGTGAVIPALLEEISLDGAEMARVRSAGSQEMQRLVIAAQRAGMLRRDITAADIGTIIVRLSRPLPGPFPADLNASLAHRHLDLMIGGLRARPGRPARISGPRMSLEDLQDMTPSRH